MRNTSNQRSSLRDKMISSAFPLKCSAVPVPSSAETAGAVSVGKHALPILAAQHVLTTQVPIKDCEHLLFIVVRSSVLILPRPPFTIAAAQYSSPLVTFESLASELSSVGITLSAQPTTIEGGTSALPTYSHSTTRTLPSDFTVHAGMFQL